MNLPAPEDSGVPPDNPDSCILRIRRNHLIEVHHSVKVLWARAARVAGSCVDLMLAVAPAAAG
jgi:hypothetical protein